MDNLPFSESSHDDMTIESIPLFNKKARQQGPFWSASSSCRTDIQFYLAAAIIAGTLSNIPVFAEQVSNVHDGDTLTLINGRRVRLAGIDAPELSQPLGVASRDFLTAQVIGREVTVECAGRSYKRAVCQVYVNGVHLQPIMVRNGWAFDEPRYSKGAWAADEADARRQGLGVWALPDGGVRPWVWRKRY